MESNQEPPTPLSASPSTPNHWWYRKPVQIIIFIILITCIALISVNRIIRDVRTQQFMEQTDHGTTPSTTTREYKSYFAQPFPADKDTKTEDVQVSQAQARMNSDIVPTQKNIETSVGPAVIRLLSFLNNKDNNQHIMTLRIHILSIPNIDSDAASIIPTINHIFTKDGRDILDKEYQPLQALEGDRDVTNFIPLVPSDTEPIHFSGPFRAYATELITEENLGSIEGVITITLPTSDGGTFVKELPFVLK